VSFDGKVLWVLRKAKREMGEHGVRQRYLLQVVGLPPRRSPARDTWVWSNLRGFEGTSWQGLPEGHRSLSLSHGAYRARPIP
jgi:hypothetical protein